MKTATQQVMKKGEIEKAILLKYAESQKVEDSDIEVLREYENVGIIHIGFSFWKKRLERN